MRLHDYQKAALRTLDDKNNINFESIKNTLIHSCLGISSEIGEILEDTSNAANIIQEVGDVAWYCAIGLHAVSIDMEDVEASMIIDDPWDEIVVFAGIASDCVKRHVFYGTDIDTEKYSEAIGNIIACIEMIALDSGESLARSLEKNIEKLRIRYPDKFTQENAVNRDPKKEGKVF